MKSLYGIFFLLFFGSSLSAQNVDYNRIILPDGAEDISIEERLVRIAWRNYPLNEEFRRNVNIARLQVKTNRWSWLDNVGVVGNLNEFNLDPSRDIDNRSQFFPRYNVSARASLGMFISLPIQTQISKERLSIEQSRLNERKLLVRAEVLRLYEAYKAADEVFQIQNEILEDSQTESNVLKAQFESGQIQIDEYNNAQTTLYKNRLAQIAAKQSLEQIKIDLEMILGVPLEEVL